jgi:predicted DNA-binding transcriptional regulator AlpA
MNYPTSSKPKAQPRYAKLDGRPLARPRGRHAVARSDTSDEDAKRQVVTIPVNQRLGFRVREFAALLGVSYATIWRQIRDEKIPIVEIAGMKLVPRAFAIERGLISENDDF